MKDIAIFGIGGFGREVVTIIDHINQVSPEWNFIGFFDDDETKSVQQYPYLGTLGALNEYPKPVAIVLAIGNPVVRHHILTNISNPNVSYPTLIHPKVTIGEPASVTIGEGSILAANVILTTNITLGKHSILNLGVTVGHDSNLGDFASLMPGVNIAGEVEMGKKVYIGLGANVINDIRIGSCTVIGGGSLVNRDLEGSCTAVGVPAKIIKKADVKC